MSKYKFSYAQKYALWRAYGMECFYCERSLDFKNVTIDHVIPEYLENEGNEAEWKRIRADYELEENFPNFSINDCCNWVPSDGPGCNFRKGETLLPKKVTLFYLSQIQKQLPRVEKELVRLSRNRKRSKVLGELSVAVEENTISKSHVVELLRELEFERTREEPLVITLGFGIDDLLDDQLLPELPAEITENYVALCNWLEKDLSDSLRSLSPYSFHYTEESARSGETLSVRLVFPELSLDELDKLELNKIQEAIPWWKVLEVTNFYQVYGLVYQEAYLQQE